MRQQYEGGSPPEGSESDAEKCLKCGTYYLNRIEFIQHLLLHIERTSAVISLNRKDIDNYYKLYNSKSEKSKMSVNGDAEVNQPEEVDIKPFKSLVNNNKEESSSAIKGEDKQDDSGKSEPQSEDNMSVCSDAGSTMIVQADVHASDNEQEKSDPPSNGNGRPPSQTSQKEQSGAEDDEDCSRNSEDSKSPAKPTTPSLTFGKFSRTQTDLSAISVRKPEDLMAQTNYNLIQKRLEELYKKCQTSSFPLTRCVNIQDSSEPSTNDKVASTSMRSVVPKDDDLFTDDEDMELHLTPEDLDDWPDSNNSQGTQPMKPIEKPSTPPRATSKDAQKRPKATQNPKISDYFAVQSKKNVDPSSQNTKNGSFNGSNTVTSRTEQVCNFMGPSNLSSAGNAVNSQQNNASSLKPSNSTQDSHQIEQQQTYTNKQTASKLFDEGFSGNISGSDTNFIRGFESAVPEIFQSVNNFGQSDPDAFFADLFNEPNVQTSLEYFGQSTSAHVSTAVDFGTTTVNFATTAVNFGTSTQVGNDLGGNCNKESSDSDKLEIDTRSNNSTDLRLADFMGSGRSSDSGLSGNPISDVGGFIGSSRNQNVGAVSHPAHKSKGGRRHVPTDDNEAWKTSEHVDSKPLRPIMSDLGGIRQNGSEITESSNCNQNKKINLTQVSEKTSGFEMQSSSAQNFHPRGFGAEVTGRPNSVQIRMDNSCQRRPESALMGRECGEKLQIFQEPLNESRRNDKQTSELKAPAPNMEELAKSFNLDRRSVQIQPSTASQLKSTAVKNQKKSKLDQNSNQLLFNGVTIQRRNLVPEETSQLDATSSHAADVLAARSSSTFERKFVTSLLRGNMKRHCLGENRGFSEEEIMKCRSEISVTCLKDSKPVGAAAREEGNGSKDIGTVPSHTEPLQTQCEKTYDSDGTARGRNKGQSSADEVVVRHFSKFADTPVTTKSISSHEKVSRAGRNTGVADGLQSVKFDDGSTNSSTIMNEGSDCSMSEGGEKLPPFAQSFARPSVLRTASGRIVRRPVTRKKMTKSTNNTDNPSTEDLQPHKDREWRLKRWRMWKRAQMRKKKLVSLKLSKQPSSQKLFKSRTLVEDTDSNESFEIKRNPNTDALESSTLKPLVPVALSDAGCSSPGKTYTTLQPCDPFSLITPASEQSHSPSRHLPLAKNNSQDDYANGDFNAQKDLFGCALCPQRFVSAAELEAHAAAEGHIICSMSDACASLNFESPAALAHHQSLVHQPPVQTTAVQRLAAQVERLPQTFGGYSAPPVGGQASYVGPTASSFNIPPPSYNAPKLGSQVVLTPMPAAPAPSLPNLPGIQVTKRTAAPPVESSPIKINRTDDNVPKIRLPDSITLVKSQPAPPPQNHVADMLATRGITMVASGSRAGPTPATSIQPVAPSPPKRLPNVPSAISIVPTRTQPQAQKFAVPPAPQQRGRTLGTVDLTKDDINGAAARMRGRPIAAPGGPPRRFSCTICDKVYPSGESLQAHMAVHGARQGRFMCDICKVVYTNEAKLINHKKTVHAVRPPPNTEFVIPICDINQPGVKEKLLQCGIRHVVQVQSVRNANDTAAFGLPIIPIDLARNEAYSRLDDLGASNILSLGTLRNIYR